MSSKVLLADGSTGILHTWESYRCLASVGDSVWALHSTGEYVDIRDQRSGKLFDTLHLPETCCEIQRVVDRVWFLSATGKIVIYEVNGLLLGLLDSNVGHIDRLYVLESCPSFLASSQKGSFHIWNAASTEVQKTFHCDDANMVAIFPLQPWKLILTVQEDCISVWDPDGYKRVTTHAIDRTVAAVVLPHFELDSSKDQRIFFWTGGNKWISVFSVSFSGIVCIAKERLIPCTSVRQLVLISASRVVSLDTEFLVTVWDAKNYSPIRLFKINTAFSLNNINILPSIFYINTIEVTTVWTLCGSSCLAWEDNEMHMSNSGQRHDKFLDSVNYEEILLLRKKIACLIDMMDAYRRKVLEVISSPNSDSKRASATVIALEKCFRDQLAVLQEDNVETNNNLSSTKKTSEILEFWRQKYILERERNSLLLLDFQQMSQAIPNSENELNVNLKIAEIIKAYTASQSRESELRGRLVQLESQLLGIPAVGHSNEVETSKSSQTFCDEKEMHRLRTMIAELQEELRYSISAEDTSTMAQREIQRLTETLRLTEEKLKLSQERVESLSKRLFLTDSKNKKLLETVEVLHRRIKMAEEDRIENTRILESQQQAAADSEEHWKTKFCEMDKELSLCHQHLDEGMKQKKLLSVVSAQKEEILGLQKLVDDLEKMIANNHDDSVAAYNAFDSISALFKSLEEDSPSVRLTEILEGVDRRLSRVEEIGHILGEKEDLLAVKDDELHAERSSLMALQKRMKQVCSLFSSIPYKIEDIETLILELNEYHERYGVSEEIQEAVAIKILELKANSPDNYPPVA